MAMGGKYDYRSIRLFFFQEIPGITQGSGEVWDILRFAVLAVKLAWERAPHDVALLCICANTA